MTKSSDDFVNSAPVRVLGIPLEGVSHAEVRGVRATIVGWAWIAAALMVGRAESQAAPSPERFAEAVLAVDGMV